MSYLHAHNIIHGNLKPENILFDTNLNPKITDFGFSNFNYQDSILKSSNEKLIYTPPEIFSDLKFTKESDVYSFSMIVYEILTTERPFKNHSQIRIIMDVSNGKRPEIGSSIPAA